MLKIAKKWPHFALSGQFWLQLDFFVSPLPPLTSSPKNFEPPHQKFREKTLCNASNLWYFAIRNKPCEKLTQASCFISKLQILIFSGNFYCVGQALIWLISKLVSTIMWFSNHKSTELSGCLNKMYTFPQTKQSNKKIHTCFSELTIVW